MKHIFLIDNVVNEIIPDENPVFPGVPIKDRYAPDFVSKLLHISDETEVHQNWTYDPETKTFSAPVMPEIEVEEPQE